MTTHTHTYTLWNTGQITDNRTNKHAGWFIETTRTLTTAPYQLDNGIYGFNYPTKYPHAKINHSVATQDGKKKLFDALEELING